VHRDVADAAFDRHVHRLIVLPIRIYALLEITRSMNYLV